MNLGPGEDVSKVSYNDHSPAGKAGHLSVIEELVCTLSKPYLVLSLPRLGFLVIRSVLYAANDTVVCSQYHTCYSFPFFTMLYMSTHWL